jgi:hypothetical protein
MRKISIGIFVLATVIMFFLSTSISVTAATHQETLMELTSKVWDADPKALVIMDPQDVWTYADWEWSLEINNGDNVYIDTKCIWLNGNNPSVPDSGYHYYYVDGTYIKGLTYKQDDDNHIEWTDGVSGSAWEQGDITLTLEFDNLERGGTIFLYWYVQAINYEYPGPPEAEDEHTGTVYLT